MQSENPNGVQMTLYATKEEKRALMLIDLFHRLMYVVCHRAGKMEWSIDPRRFHKHLPHFFEGLRITPYDNSSNFYSLGEDGECRAFSFFKKVTDSTKGETLYTYFCLYLNKKSIEELEKDVWQPVQGLELPPGTRSMSHMLKVTRETLVLMGVLEEAEEEVTAGA